MKKFFTLFALLSVGLSAWAQTYTLTCREGFSFSEEMKDNGDGTYSLRKLFYFNSNRYIFVAGEWGYDVVSLSTGWYDITFIYKPEQLSHTINEGPVRDYMRLSDCIW